MTNAAIQIIHSEHRSMFAVIHALEYLAERLGRHDATPDFRLLNAILYYVREYPERLLLTGKQGKVYQDSKNMELAGDVVLTSNEGYQFKTQSVSYRHAEKIWSTSDPVEIEGEQLRLTGIGMWVDTEAKTLKIISQVKTQLRRKKKGMNRGKRIHLLVMLFCFLLFSISGEAQDKKGDRKSGEKVLKTDRNFGFTTSRAPIDITSDTVEADMKTNTITFKGNVVAKQEDTTLYANTLTITYDQNEKKVKEIVAVGNVKALQLERRATGQKATFDQDKNKVVMDGVSRSMTLMPVSNNSVFVASSET